MPVSHLGLTVSHIPSATSFYLSALQPLGYRYLGSRGNSIGLGVHEADFFLSQELEGYRGAPTHIAFSAQDRSTVRNCYTAALNAGAHPSGPPSYRQDDCKCFNAAVEDLDGNTIEFIWRDGNPIGHYDPMIVDHGRSALAARPTESQASPRMGIQRARTDPVDTASKSILGVVLGATVAAVGYAMVSSERNSAREDAQHSSYIRARERPSDGSRRSASVASGGRRRASLAGSRASEYLPPDLVVRQIDAKPYRDDEDISYTRQRVTRHSQGQTRALEAIEYGPSRSRATTEYGPGRPREAIEYGSSRSRAATEYSASRPRATIEHGPVRSLTRRSATMPMEELSNRRGSIQQRTSRRDSVVSRTTSKSRQASEPRSSYSQASTVKPIKKDAAYYLTAAAGVPLPPSLVSKAPPPASTGRSSRRSRFDAYYLDEPEDDGLGDTATLVPDDSISCVNLPRSNSRRGSKTERRGSSKTEGRDSSKTEGRGSSKTEGRGSSKTERRGSIMTIPMRSGREQFTTRNAHSNA